MRTERPARSPPAAGREQDEDIAFQRLTWRVERVGWASLWVLILVALSGLTGQGPLGHGAAASPDGTLSVRYERITRAGRLAPLTVRLAGAAARPLDGALRLSIDAAFVRDGPARTITPPPAAAELRGMRLVYSFPVAARAESAVFEVTFALEPARVGVRRAVIGVEDGPRVGITQLVWP